MRCAHSEVVRSAAYYELRAEEVATIADKTVDPWCRKVLRGSVEDYIRLAGDRLNAERKREEDERA